MTEPSKHKFKVYQPGQMPSEMTSDELTTIIAGGLARAKFPKLCDAFARAVQGKFKEHIDKLDVTSTEQAAADSQKIMKSLTRLVLKDLFHRTAFVLTPPIGGLKAAALKRLHDHDYRCTEQMAGLAIDVFGAYQAARLVPEPMKTPLNAEICNELKMQNLGTLIQRSLQ